MPINAGNCTLLDAIVKALRELASAPDGTAMPAAILWTDPKSQFLPLKDALMGLMPEMVALGGYSPGTRTSPAIWIRCVVDGSIALPNVPNGAVPVVYMPGVATQELRAGEDCPERLVPLVELLYRGATWLQRSSVDWTVTAFLTSADALGLDIDRSQAARDALLRALPVFALLPLAGFAGRRLEAEDFDALLVEDPVRDVLRWLSNPMGRREQMDAAVWEAFRNQCRQKFAFDPERDGEIVAGERMGTGVGPWASVWERYAEAPSTYPGIVRLLKVAQPHTLTLDRSRWPKVNEEEEISLRGALEALAVAGTMDICAKVESLENRHAERRGWIWATLGYSPLAKVMEPLVRIARVAKSALGGANAEEIAANYESAAWLADAASWEALADTSLAILPLVSMIVSLMMKPWLDESARAFQRTIEARPASLEGREAISVEPGTCLLFIDGLRYDVGQRLAEQLRMNGLVVQSGRRWAALPTVTATGKPAVTPITSRLTGNRLEEDFSSRLVHGGRVVDASVLRAELQREGYHLVECEFLMPPESDTARGWAECGNLDTRGHDMQDEFARQVTTEIEYAANRIAALLELGWKKVRVVTDHGWLFLPGGLPRVDLPHFLTLTRWSRCAVISGESQVDMPRYSWHWNASEYFASPPGIACFNASPSYAHGGVSIQECLLPDLVVETSQGPAEANIRDIHWVRLRCLVEAQTSASGVTVDLRTGGPAGRSVAQRTKVLDSGGTANLVVDADFEGKDLFLVLLDVNNVILAQQRTRVGG